MDLLESVQEENNIENIPGHHLTENLLPLLSRPQRVVVFQFRVG